MAFPGKTGKTAPGGLSRSRFLSPAKVNLYLKVLSKRLDGYHEIESLMQAVSLYDEITIGVGEGDGIEISCSSPQAPSDRTNLAFRAAELFLKIAGIKKTITIELIKNTPVGAGLGGGSSNAATVLMGLNTLTGARLSPEKLMEAGALLGSDVPFFILGRAAVAKGRGEVLKPVSLPSFQYILINPGFQVSTAWVYNNLDLTKKLRDYILTYSEEAFKKADRIQEYLVNDLEEVTLKRYPEISGLKNALIDAGASGSLMSGSGPTVFGIFPDRGKALSAFEKLKARLDRNYSIFVAEGL